MGACAPRTEEPKTRDQTMCAFKDSAVKQVTRGLSGSVETWYPPAGIYCENSSKGCAQNMWKFLPPEKRHVPERQYNWGAEGEEAGARHVCLSA